MNIAFLAHDKKKELMVQFCTAYKSILAKHSLSATATTGRLVADATGLPISLFLSQRAGHVYGVEIIPQAIEDAKANAKRNGIINAEFFVGKAEEVLPEFYEKMTAAQAGGVYLADDIKTSSGLKPDMLHPDVIVVDPPRKGCDTACLDTMLKMQPERIVYVSCDSATLARDVKYLREGGYELKKWRAVDQFGMTVHTEVCVKLCRKK